MTTCEGREDDPKTEMICFPVDNNDLRHIPWRKLVQEIGRLRTF